MLGTLILVNWINCTKLCSANPIPYSNPSPNPNSNPGPMNPQNAQHNVQNVPDTHPHLAGGESLSGSSRRGTLGSASP